MSRPFDEDDEEFEEVGPEVIESGEPSALLPPVGDVAEEEVWDEADFDDEFDDDFDDEPDEDLERFEKELNDENIEADKDLSGDFDEDADF